MAKNKRTGGRRQSGTGHDPVVAVRYSAATPTRQMKMSEAMRLAAKFSDQSNEQAAQVIYNQLSQQYPMHSEPAAALLHSLQSVGQMDAAQLQAYRMLSTMKNDANAIDQVAEFYLKLEKTEEALKILDHGLKDCPHESCSVLHRSAGNIHELKGDIEKAISCYEKAVSIDDGDVNSLFQLSNLHKKSSGDYLDKRISRDWLLNKLLAVSKKKTYFTKQETFPLFFPGLFA